MTCVKTGCDIYLNNYGMSVHGDAYAVGNTHIFRWVVGSQNYEARPESCRYHIGYVDNDEKWWHREDLGIIVVRNDSITIHPNGR